MAEHDKRGGDVNLRSGPQMREYEVLADRVAGSAPGRTLDWGCGWGQVTEMLRQRGVAVQPFDYVADAEAPGRAALERYPDIEYDYSPDPVALPYEDASFDTVLSCGVLEHVADPDASLDELRRVLRPGGTLCVVKLPNETSYLEWVAKKAGLYYHGQLEHDTIYTVESARAIVGRHGFRVTGARRANMLPLSVDHPVVARFTSLIWALNRLLERVPGLNRLATNVEVDAVRA